jgi:hypothetical protein
MTIATQLRTAFAATKAAIPSAVVSVVYGGRTASGLAQRSSNARDLTTAGNSGEFGGVVKVDTADMATPKSGETFKVAGQDCFVDDVQTDGAGILMTITYSRARPYEPGAS